MSEIRLDDVTKVFAGSEAPAVDHLSLTIADGEFVILVGPSGCGKTTALRMVAGLEKPTSGLIAIGGRTVNDVSPRDRDIAMVFQNYALYPHMTVYRNLAFGLKQRRVPKAEIDRRVREAGAMLGLDDLLRRRPAQLSGGQRQRVAMGRALVREPTAFLMDEPLSNLDAKLRVQMRAELKRQHRTLGVTTLYVTHDQVEAMTLGDRIAVLSKGRLMQVGQPQDVYERPANLFVASFIGSPPMNLLRGDAGGGVLRAGDLCVPVASVRAGPVIVGLRPETLTPSTADGMPAIDLRVDVVEPLGDAVMVHGTVSGMSAQVESVADGELLSLPGSQAEVTARLDARARPSPGEVIRLGVVPDEVHVFDPATGATLR